jgi:hypothetical protein
MLRPIRPVGQSVLVSSTSLGPKTRFLLMSVADLSMWGSLFDERTGQSFTIAEGSHKPSHSRIRDLRDSFIFLSKYIVTAAES